MNPESVRPIEDEHRPIDSVAGLMAAAAIFVGLVAIAYRPARVAPAAIFVALLAAGMSRRAHRLAGIATLVAGLGWLIGMSIAVATGNPIW